MFFPAVIVWVVLSVAPEIACLLAASNRVLFFAACQQRPSLQTTYLLELFLQYHEQQHKGYWIDALRTCVH